MLRYPLIAALVAAAVAAPSHAATFGTDPLNISVGPGGEPADGASGGPTVSGDDRRTRLAAFHSDATNLVSGDGNGQRDVFLWRRPGGAAGLQLDRVGAVNLERVSVPNGGGEANGASQNPSLDGSMRRAPHCVAFESQASNLVTSDPDPEPDVFVRDLSSRRTIHVSDGVSGAATNPSIEGDCGTVLFQAGGSVYQARVRGGRPKKLGSGGNPDIGLDGTGIAWESGGGVIFRRAGASARIRGAKDPIVSDEESGKWGVGYERGGVRLGVFGSRGGSSGTVNVARGGSILAGVTAFAANRGIVTYATGRTLYYFNKNSGNSDDLAVANETISEAAASARANFVAFTATGGQNFRGDGNGGVPDVWFKHLVDGQAL